MIKRDTSYSLIANLGQNTGEGHAQLRDIALEIHITNVLCFLIRQETPFYTSTAVDPQGPFILVYTIPIYSYHIKESRKWSSII